MACQYLLAEVIGIPLKIYNPFYSQASDTVRIVGLFLRHELLKKFK